MFAKKALASSSRAPLATAVASSSQSQNARISASIAGRRSIASSSTSAERRHPVSGQVRSYSLEPQSLGLSDNSLFSSNADWDSAFLGLKTSIPTRSARQAPRSLGPGPTVPRRQSMTIREMSAFDDMFSRVFNAAAIKNTPRRKPGSSATASTTTDIPVDLLSQLRRHSKNVHWASEADEEFDRKKEEMNLCESDHQLLAWAQREVFDESKRYQAAAAEAARRKAADPTASSSSTDAIHLQPLSYPLLISLLMRTFRDKYGDPHLALSIFNHARHLSVPSFVFGCTTGAYNELIETRWKCFRDLSGVVDALEEMKTNAVKMDSKTKALCEIVRRECGGRELWREQRNMEGSEVWDMLQVIDKVLASVNNDLFIQHGREVVDASRAEEPEDMQTERELGEWKKRLFETPDLNRNTKDGWEFGEWGDEDLDSRSTTGQFSYA
ncbi:hypothetical protein EIP91_005321 [Steccherinum ochraceum]|uniref:Mtf2-like C-terminal domain-containing protein n=1 Tax=Steccherinum ochraceum TaxID=92696 RepID=A0A4R0R7C3_9APHY|nr:hypothetical protein EIP91_005321 [Steccherinum ochraceum]